MADSAPFALRARVVLPVRRPPIPNGAVIVSGNSIAAVDRWRSLRPRFTGRIHDLGDSILLPGLVNAHCHLDYTDMAGEFLPPRSFTDWITLIVAAKAGWTYSDFAQSWLNGARMLLRTGTTTVADFENAPELLPEIWDATPLRVFSFLEMTGVKSGRDPKLIVADAVKKIESLGKSSRCIASLAPHAPYSTVPELLRVSGQVAARRNWLLSAHVAESAEEFDMFMQGRGVMFDALKRNKRDPSDCGLGSPVRHLDRAGALGENLLAVHVNYLADGDTALLAKRKVSVVHCPRSHDFFRHRDFPRRTLAKAGVNLCLGTDSLATVRKHPRPHLELNLFHEMRAFAAKYTGVSARQILRMATINGAIALGLPRRIGEISTKAFADLIAIPSREKLPDIYQAVVHHSGDVAASMIGGEWAIPPK